MKNKLWRSGLISVGVFLLLIISYIGAGPITNESPSQPAKPVGLDTDQAVKQVFPALVRIHVVTTFYEEGREQKFEAAGSGTIISPDGYVVTNHHVVGRAKWIRCTLPDKEEVDATLIGTDAMSDIAVIKLKPETMRHPEKTFPYAKWGDSSNVKLGERVLAMGSPMAVSQSVTYGIVSNTELIIPEFLQGMEFTMEGEDVGSIVKWIAHDAVIYGGNSGGPLVNLKGEIIGVNEIGLGSLGGAIPSNLAAEIAKALIAEGEVKRSWIGVEIQPLLRSSNLEQGVLVNEVTKDSPADKAGVKTGDVILSYDGQQVRVRYGEEMPLFNQLILGTPIGKTVVLEVLRDGKTQSFTIQTAARSKARDNNEEIRNWGITARNITPLMARELKCSTDGVFVSSARPGGPGGQAKPSLQGKDVIVQIGNNTVKNLKEFKEISANITQGQDKPVPVLVAFKRGAQKLLTVVKIGPSEEEQVSPEVRKAWFPAAIQVFTRPLADAMKLQGKKGVCITQLYPPLNKGDSFQVGDILTAIDDIPIEASEQEDSLVFPNMIRRYKIGQEITLNVIRNNKEIKIPFKLIEEPKPSRELEKYKDDNLGFTARELRILDLSEKQLSEATQGVLIEAVESGSCARLGHLAISDILLSVDNNQISSISDLKKIMTELVKKKPKHVIFFVQRDIHTFYLELTPDWIER
ncbi:MAG: PDZ domain-containing protein [Planctomycetota bacterium]